jgi:acetyl-CoA carboxylase biotin carboxyl carrier protein
VVDLTDDDVMTILSLFEESEFDYLQFESGELKLTVSKHGYVPTPAAVPVPAAPVTSPSAAEPPDEQPKPAPEPQTAAPRPPASDAAAREGLVPITAPIVGTFYVAPDPQSPPFVSVGDQVNDGSTVGLIEVMKVFTSVRAGIAGEIVDIAVSNAQLVELGEVLFYIRPDQPSG